MNELPSRVYHLVEQANYESVLRDGLKPANVLIAESGEDAAWRSRHRAEHHVLPDGVQIRDQKPMPPRALMACLHQMSPGEWYELLNSHVFFWLDRDRLERQRTACLPRVQLVLELDSRKLMDAFGGVSYLTPINTGFARRKPARRGHASFVPYETWQLQGWATEAESLGVSVRPRSHAPVELAIRGVVTDVASLLVARPVGR